MRNESLQILDSAPGPTPWYMAAGTREIPSERGLLSWWDATSGAKQGGGKKALTTSDGTALALFNYYCYLKLLGQRRLLAWTTNTPYPPNLVFFRVIDVDRLDPIRDVESACAEIDANSLRWLASGGDLATVRIPANLDAGTNRWEFPLEMQVLDELLLLCHGNETSLWIIRPKDGTVEVYPQDWFNHGDYDFGYQWPTRVARDPETGIIVGDGIRIDLFALDDSYRQLSVPRLRQWLDHD
jgi:hypothetical protein